MAQCVQFLIATPTVTINNIAFATVSDSVEVTKGTGTTNVVAASAGGNAICQIVSHDITDSFGMLKFSVHTTKDNVNLITRFLERQFRARLTAEVTGTDNTTGETLTFSTSFASITNDPVFKFGPGGQFDVEVKGRPFV